MDTSVGEDDSIGSSEGNGTEMALGEELSIVDYKRTHTREGEPARAVDVSARVQWSSRSAVDMVCYQMEVLVWMYHAWEQVVEDETRESCSWLLAKGKVFSTNNTCREIKILLVEGSKQA